MSINQKEVALGDYFKVTIFEYHNERYELALLTGYRRLDHWEIDYDVMEQITGIPDVITVDSQMQVYGMVNNIYNHLHEQFPSMMKNTDRWC